MEAIDKSNLIFKFLNYKNIKFNKKFSFCRIQFNKLKVMMMK
jgi:hypothetical protein